MLETWLSSSVPELAMVALSAMGIYAAVIVFTRLAGLRSFSKMSAFDFAMTVATGSLVATTLLTDEPSLLQGVVGLATIFLLQKFISMTRMAKRASLIIDNEPILLMHKGRTLDENLSRANITKDDLRSKLREANVTQRGRVHAVILETTGDISVMHSDEAHGYVDAWLLEGVRDPQSERDLTDRYESPDAGESGGA